MLAALNRHPNVLCVGIGILLSTLWALGIWGPISTTLRNAHAAETRRLREAFREPLTIALAQEDDLAKIDLLSQLKKLPGVLSAEMDPGSGQLNIQVTRTPWQSLRYQCLERLWGGIFLAALAGGLIGRLITKHHRALKTRFITTFRRSQKRRCRAFEHIRQNQAADRLQWTRQAMSFSNVGLVLLDPHQKLVAYNSKAGDGFRLEPTSLGVHWLDLQSQAGWVSALRNTLEHPGESVSMPAPKFPGGVSLLTFSTPEQIAASTWIILWGP